MSPADPRGAKYAVIGTVATAQLPNGHLASVVFQQLVDFVPVVEGQVVEVGRRAATGRRAGVLPAAAV